MVAMCVRQRKCTSPDARWGPAPETLCAPEGFAQLAFGALQHILAVLRQAFAAAVDVEVEHRHRRLIGCALAALAGNCGPLERLSDCARAFQFENPTLEVEGIASLVDPGGPPAVRSLASSRQCRHGS